MSRFYVTLPSNSSAEYYPNNTVARYTTKLADKIELEGDWEVGLAEISFPSAVKNVVRGQHYYDLYMNDLHMCTIHLPSRQHRRMQTVVDAMHIEQRKQLPLQSEEPLPVEFSFSHATGKVSMKLREQTGVQYAVQFSQNLARMLCVDNSLKYRQNMTGKRRASLNGNGNVNSVYIYCDILEHVAVGDTKAPLLRIVVCRQAVGSLRGRRR